MELRVLRYFLAVAQEENITAAAEVLHITQPTLSKQLKDLEIELGSTLFIRGKRKITLTEDGMFLRKHAQEIIALADKTEAAFRDKQEFVGGDIYIGGGESIAVKYIAKALSGLLKTYPNIRYHFISGDGNDIAEQLDKGLIDFALFIGLMDLKKYDHIILPTTDTWGLLLRNDHPLAENKTITPNDLIELPILHSRQAFGQNELSGWLGYSPEKLNIIGTHNLVYNESIMVKEGIGCAITLDGLANTSAENGLCFLPFEPKITARLAIAWKKYQVFSKPAELFLKRITREFGHAAK